MSFAKSELARLEELARRAQIVANDVGAISLDFDTDDAEYNYDPEADRHAYARVIALCKAGKLDGTPREARRAVAQVLEGAF